MDILEKILAKQSDLRANKSITIAFLGDSITQGCFDCYYTRDNHIETVFEYQNAYSTRLRELINVLYPKVQINIINSGISGDTAEGGLERIERDVLRFNPDLVVVSFGLNDCACGLIEGVENYGNKLRGIFNKITESGAECIYLTECVMNDAVSPHLRDERLVEYAKRFMKIQKDGIPDLYFEKGRQVAKDCEVKICDLYRVWKAMQKAGVEVTELFANKLNHPIREFHYYIAIKLLETMLDL